jgi:hypothetical protein
VTITTNCDSVRRMTKESIVRSCTIFLLRIFQYRWMYQKPPVLFSSSCLEWTFSEGEGDESEKWRGRTNLMMEVIGDRKESEEE